MTETWHETPTEKEQLEYKIYKLEQEIARLREALEVILDAAQKDEPCVLAIKSVAYMALKEKGE